MPSRCSARASASSIDAPADHAFHAPITSSTSSPISEALDSTAGTGNRCARALFIDSVHQPMGQIDLLRQLTEAPDLLLGRRAPLVC